jgi:hypothetical protein
MKSVQAGLMLVGALMLAGCDSLVRQAADNTAVDVVPLASAKLSGTMSAGLQTMIPQTMTGQTMTGQTAVEPGGGTGPLALFTVAFSSGPIAFGDFDPASLPAALQNPSGLDIPIVISDVTLSCTPSASPLTLTISGATLTVSDAVNGTQSVKATTNTVLTLTKTATGYSVGSTPIVINAKWADLKAIVTKNGAETPNTATLSLTASFNDGLLGCLSTLNLASTLKQNVRF